MSKIGRIAGNPSRCAAAKSPSQSCRNPGGVPLIGPLAGWVLACLLAWAGPAAASGIEISGPEALARAVQQAQGGETFLLAPGNYGDMVLRRTFIDTVTIASAEPHGARFGKLEVLGGGGLRFSGIDTNVFSAVREAIGIELVNARVRDLSYFRNGADIPVYTATRSSVREAGRRAAQMLIDIINGKDSTTEILLEAELTLGMSTGPARRN